VQVNPILKRQSKARPTLVERQLAELDAEIARDLAKDHSLARKGEILRSIPGLGPIAAALNPHPARAVQRDAHFAVNLQIQHLRHAPARGMAGSAQKWQEGGRRCACGGLRCLAPCLHAGRTGRSTALTGTR